MTFAAGLEINGGPWTAACEQIVRLWKSGDVAEASRSATSEDLAAAFAASKGLPLLRDPWTLADPALVKAFDPAFLRQAFGLPVCRDDGFITIAVANPYLPLLEDRVHQLFPGVKVQLAVCPVDDLVPFFDSLVATRRDDTPEAILRGVQVVEEDSGVREFALEGETGSPPEKALRSILRRAITDRASDVHFAVERDRFYYETRINGRLSADSELSAAAATSFDAFLVQLAGRTPEDRAKGPVSGRFTIRGRHVRVDVRYERHSTHHGFHVALRLNDIQGKAPQIGAGGLLLEHATEANIRRLLEAPDGIIVISGPTGSGKSTTLYAMVRELNRPEYAVLTLENPVEFEIPGVKQVQIQDLADAKRYLSSFMRSDPDIMLIAEVRDRETAEIAAEAANTGHLVLTTVHTMSAAQILTRFEHLGVPRWKIASTIIGACAQRLVLTLCPHCRMENAVTEDQASLYQLPKEEWVGMRAFAANPKGCAHCRNGYNGRTALLEVVPITRAIRERIESPDFTVAGLEQHIYRDMGIRSVRDLGLALVREGRTDLVALADVVRMTID